MNRLLIPERITEAITIQTIIPIPEQALLQSEVAEVQEEVLVRQVQEDQEVVVEDNLNK